MVGFRSTREREFENIDRCEGNRSSIVVCALLINLHRLWSAEMRKSSFYGDLSVKYITILVAQLRAADKLADIFYFELPLLKFSFVVSYRCS